MTLVVRLASQAARALDGLADLRLRTAPHTEDARRQRVELREKYGLRRPEDAVACFQMVTENLRGDEPLEKLVLDWPLAVALDAAINLEDPDGAAPVLARLAKEVPALAPRVAACLVWARRARSVTEAMSGLVGRSRVMDDVRTAAWRAVFTDDVRKALALRAPHRMSVLITGESGTGKELVARTIAGGRPRDEKGRLSPYIALNIAGVAPSLVNSALFGHARGSFTGATEDRPGVFQAASGGVLFLDEIGDASSAVQVRLLRTLQEGTVRPVGADQEVPVTVRVVAATNRDLARRAPGRREPRFRRDLLERLTVLRVHAPPLRDRLEDVPELVRQFVREAVDVAAWPQLADQVRERLERETRGHDWPGNVRELKAAVDRVVAGQPARLDRDGDAGRGGTGPDLVRELGVLPLREVRRRYVEAILQRAGTKSEAARLLGVDRNTLARILSAPDEAPGPAPTEKRRPRRGTSGGDA